MEHAPAPPTPLSIAPPPGQMLAALTARRTGGGASSELFGRSLEAWRIESRRELAAATGADRADPDAPLVGTGHQPRFWHPGIVVKPILANLLAERSGGTALHVIVEQDADPPLSFDVPVRRDDGTLGVRRIEPLRHESGVIVARIAPFDPDAALGERGLEALLARGSAPATESVAAGLAAMSGALRRRRGESDLARQVTEAAFDLLEPVTPRLPIIGSGALLSTTFAGELLRAMARDPIACAQAYNAAVAGVPDSAPPLRILDDRVEVPLWRLDDAGRRMHAWEDDLDRFRAGTVQLLPRALLMTALLRVGLCDLFLHGTGGAAYDVAMERWMHAWLGAPTAPAGSATATRLLPLPATTPQPEAPRATLLARYRRALSDPESIDREGNSDRAGNLDASSGAPPGPWKRSMLDEIDRLPRRSPQRRSAWRAMHDELEQRRAASAPALDALAQDVRDAETWLRIEPILHTRTWPFPFHDETTLRDLRAAVERSLTEE